MALHVNGQTFAPKSHPESTESTVSLGDLPCRQLRTAGVSFRFTRPAGLGTLITTAGQQLLDAVADKGARGLIDTVLAYDTAPQTPE
ncbi:hypothetical protein [Streptomyces niveus]|uniref:hypothetical protein n=1 Tax=Streptomyces niveus TaxID=193462 RepID=UPI00084C100E|nr:hypothetical protein [Streptomyces niveus]